MINHSQTGQLQQSPLLGCPVFIPSQLSVDLLSLLAIDKPVQPVVFLLFKGT